MRKLILFAIIILLLAVPVAYAGTSVLNMKRTVLTNVNDAAGLWQYSGGTLWSGAKQVGYYATTSRVTNGATNAFNTSMFTATLFFSGANPNRNVTLRGAWNFSPGGSIGGVSAASAPYQFLQHDGTYTITVISAGMYKLTINWTGAGSVP